MPTKTIVQDPESFEMFIRRQKKNRDDKEKDRMRASSGPGSGRVFKPQRMTKPQCFSLMTESKDFSNMSIKSVNKVRKCLTI
jgi:hypothetical protein